MLALIDGDIVLHRCGYASDKDPEDIALIRTDTMMREILVETGAEKYECWLSDGKDNNFRYTIDPQYKANRKQPRPIHYDAIKDFLYSEWNANLALGQEADDALGIRQTQLTERHDGDTQYYSVICSIDKDLLMIEGPHYNFVRKEHQHVQAFNGIKHFYKQLLIGDTSDNVRGVDKIGPVKAGKILDDLTDELSMFRVVRDLYNDDSRLLKNGKLLWIRRVEDEEWNFPKEVFSKQEQEVKLSSIKTVPKEIVQSTERTTQAMSGYLQLGLPLEDSTPQPSVL